uniref:Uncharacterized protein n=1 Tax=Anguilla anguilla TaxID=7936 RepID=A0A0E9W4S8_ANGAN
MGLWEGEMVLGTLSISLSLCGTMFKEQTVENPYVFLTLLLM